MKGCLVVIGATSQMGKDFYAGKIADELKKKEETKDIIDFAEIYKVRAHREDDPEYIKCVDTTEQIPRGFKKIDSYGQTIAIDLDKLCEDIDAGKIIILTTGSVELTEFLRVLFKGDFLDYVIVGAQRDYGGILAQQVRRYGGDIQKAQASAFERSEMLDEKIEEWQRYIEKYQPSIIENNYALSSENLKEGETFILDMGGAVQKFKVKRSKNYVAPKINDSSEENKRITNEQIRLICEEIISFIGNTPPQFGE